MGKAKALLHPIHFDEPFGLSVVEAMYCGTPVVAYRRGSMSELILHGKTGFLVNNEDEAVEVLEDSEFHLTSGLSSMGEGNVYYSDNGGQLS